MSTGDLSKLPKWARDEITRLRASLKYEEDKAARISAGATKTKIGSGLSEFENVDDHTIMQFQLNPWQSIEVAWTHDQHSGDKVQIRGAGSGFGRLMIYPIASNLAYVTVEDSYGYNERRQESQTTETVPETNEGASDTNAGLRLRQ